MGMRGRIRLIRGIPRGCVDAKVAESAIARAVLAAAARATARVAVAARPASARAVRSRRSLAVAVVSAAASADSEALPASELSRPFSTPSHLLQGAWAD